jgi:hypothetical protein
MEVIGNDPVPEIIFKIYTENLKDSFSRKLP